MSVDEVVFLRRRKPIPFFNPQERCIQYFKWRVRPGWSAILSSGWHKPTAALSLYHWREGVFTSHVSFAFDNLANPPGINIKKCSDSVLKFSSPKQFPHFYCIVVSEPTARGFSLYHRESLLLNASRGLTDATRGINVRPCTQAAPTGGYYQKPERLKRFGFAFDRIINGPNIL